jgi:hypothetical protein
VSDIKPVWEFEDLVIHAKDGNDVIEIDDSLVSKETQLYGDRGDDTICGSSQNDVIAGGHGNDTIHGGSGDDIIYGDAPALADSANPVQLSAQHLGQLAPDDFNCDDKLYGDAGEDRLHGGPGEDLFVGGMGGDEIHAVDGYVDVILPGPGDTFNVDPFDRFAPFPPAIVPQPHAPGIVQSGTDVSLPGADSIAERESVDMPSRASHIADADPTYEADDALLWLILDDLMLEDLI